MLHKNLAGLALAVGLSLASTAAFAETVTLRYSNWLPPTLFLWKEVLVPWTAEIEKVTEGRVKVQVLPKVVGSTATQFDIVRDGLADMSFITSAYTPGRFPALDVAELPLLGGDSGVLASTLDRLFVKYMKDRKEFSGVEIISIFSLSPSQPFTTANKPVKRFHDLKGLKMRSATTGVTEALTLIGAIPVHKTATEAYEMLATGTLDGQVVQPNVVVGFNLLDVTKNVFVIPGGMSNAVSMIGVNKEKWATISHKDQQLILGIARESLARQVGEAYASSDARAYQTMKEAGYGIVEASAADVEELRTLLKPMEQKWVERAKAAGFDKAEEVFAEYKAAAGALK